MELRRRWFSRVGSSLTASGDAIEVHLEALDGVRQARVFEGTGFIRIVVNGGDDNDIAQTIFINKPTGIQLLGDIQGFAIDRRGNSEVIPFSRPDVIPVFVRITISKGSEYPEDGDTTIRQLLTDFQNNISIGGIIRPSPDMIWALEPLTGIESLQIEISTDNKATYTEDTYNLPNQSILSFSEILIIEA